MGETSKRRTYDKQFKLDAVSLTTTGGRRLTEVARDLGIEPNTLHRWRREFQGDGNGAFPGKGNLTPQDEQLRHLERELKNVSEERDILKKALGIFSKLRP
jgi:transposase